MDKPVIIFACSRASDIPSCKVCHTRTRVACEYPLRGALEGKTCGTPICATHAHAQGEGGTGPFYCITHHEYARRGKQQP
jgi:hypothetical protein